MGKGWRGASVAGLAGAIALALLYVVVSAARAQDTAKPTGPQMMAKEADPDWDAVTVKPSNPNDRTDHIDSYGRHVTLKYETVENLLRFAYNLQKSQIVDVPQWFNTEHFDVDGVHDADGEPDVRQLQGLVQKILAERFGLEAHHEQREMPVFALTVANGGRKLTKSAGDPNGLPSQHGNGRRPGRESYKYTNASMPEFALMMLFYVDRPIVDRTGLSGRYDFELTWTTDDAHSAEPDAPPVLFTALREELGLKLEPVKAQVDVMVIDKAEKPGEN